MSNELYIDKKLSRNVKRIILLAMDMILILLSMILSREFLDIIVDIPNEQFYIAVVFVQIVTGVTVYSLLIFMFKPKSIQEILSALFLKISLK